VKKKETKKITIRDTEKNLTTIIIMMALTTTTSNPITTMIKIIKNNLLKKKDHFGRTGLMHLNKTEYD
jgi:hypothetical protein